MEQIKKEKSDFIKTKIKELREKIARPHSYFLLTPDPYLQHLNVKHLNPQNRF